MPSRTPTLAEVLLGFGDKLSASMRVCLPARVEKYDAAAGLVDVHPLLKDDYTGEDGSRVTESLPVIPSVPVVFPGAGGFVLSFPVQVGDTVLLVFADRSLERWIGSGEEVDPGPDPRRHHLSDAVAFAGLRPTAWGNAAAATDHATLGKDGGMRLHLKADHVELGESATDAAALASKVLSRLNAIESGFNAHVHTSAAPLSLTTPPTVPVSSSVDVSSAGLKLTS